MNVTFPPVTLGVQGLTPPLVQPDCPVREFRTYRVWPFISAPTQTSADTGWLKFRLTPSSPISTALSGVTSSG